MDARAPRKPLFWIGTSLEDLRSFPDDVKSMMGFGLHLAQAGRKHPHAKPLKGFSGAGVLEIVEDHDGDTYRAMYTIRLVGAVYVLHAFQKKSKSGIKTPAKEIALVKDRLKRAEEHHARWLKQA